MKLTGRLSRTLLYLSLAILLILTVAITPRIGSGKLEPETLDRVMGSIRIPRLLLAMLAGAGLSLAGVIFQALFRNPLAEPFTLGVTSGASLAVVLSLAFGWTGAGLVSEWNLSPSASFFVMGLSQSAIAFCGALVVVGIVYSISRWRRESALSTLLLAGVSMNFICGAGIILVYYWIREYESKQVLIWLIGSVEATGPAKQMATAAVGLVLLLGLVVVIFLHRDLDLLMMGETLAASRGVSVARTRAAAYFVASFMTACVVSVCGPIAFVGLLVPHTMRTLIGPAHRHLIPACLLFGMSLLPICDCLARNLLAWTSPENYSQLPVGVVTSVLGGIFFLILLLHQSHDRPIMT